MKNFYWGNSTSSMQTEGGWNEDGKSLSVYDVREATNTLSDWHVANDNYHNYEEDLDLMKDLGLTMYRFQISWSRVVKNGDGEFNQQGIQYYHRLIDGLLKRGIEPMICLYHFDMPLHLAEKYNGFISKEVVNAFVRFGKKMIDEFSSKVKYWLTFNEQNLYFGSEAFQLSGYLKGNRTNDELYQIFHNVMFSHTKIANYIHEKTDAKIGGMIAYSEVYPETCHPLDVFYARKWDEFMNHACLEAFSRGNYSTEVLQYVETHQINMNATESEINTIINSYSDFLSFSYYASNCISHKKIKETTLPNYYLEIGNVKNPYLNATEWGWQIDAIGFRNVMNQIYQRYHLPVFPIENGIGVKETWNGQDEIQDDYRIEYIKYHLMELKKAIYEDGVEIMGYLGWGLIDILSSQGDMNKRYGVVYVNRTNHDLKDMKRIPKKSYHWLKNIIVQHKS